MNILIPHSWLLEHLETSADPLTIQRLVSLSGPSIERIYEREGESVYDIEVTTNRADAMSVRGIAREIAAILPQFGVAALLKPLASPPVPKASEKLELPVFTENDQLNKRTLCVVLANINRAPTPDWMATRLRTLEINVHDATIDITNYITHELGHPCHAFDYDKLVASGNKIIITEAKAGESFTLLDGVTYSAVGGEVVFKDGLGHIIDLPSIKGTANSSVDDSTKRILLLAESIDANKVRFTSMTHAIQTTAAQLMEKNADPTLAIDVLNLGVKLYQEICGAKVASIVYDHFPYRRPHDDVTLTNQEIIRYLGIAIPLEKAREMLERLDCAVIITQDSLVVTPPSFRPDLTIPADIVEEVARLYGYHNLPSVLMNGVMPTNKQSGTNFILEERVKRFLAASGAQELYTYSMVGEELAKEDGFSLEQHLKIANPLTDDRVYLRRSLVPSLAQALTEMHRLELVVFELANVYHPRENDLPTEELHLTIISTYNYRVLRAQVESMLSTVHITNLEVETEPPSALSGSLTTTASTGEKHTLGSVQTDTSGRHIFDFLWSEVLNRASTHPQYVPVPKSAPLTEDLTFTLPERTAVGPLITAMRTTSSLIKQIELAALYEQNFTFHITYLDPENSISSETVAPIRAKLVAVASQTAKATLVGTLQ